VLGSSERMLGWISPESLCGLGQLALDEIVHF
jgi:hypothetical protein